ncbi:MerR family transcriptional regulator [Neobacillus bataviensis LMG 21833]|uniref:MerR family transcriptional regulator n=1 Tax=Neobacillus bataviensis LMG 21833 TaxID=1117379 RepID=K6C940_9BACI|nr:MerR family transcriptional regulator [Neobacillus bataviensis]EKN67630.1 MerR family transcriptional regulator [Neobacillus bataviensis LMG 21833]
MSVKKTENMEYLISDLVEVFGISQRSIRYYEELGLIHPRRTAGNHRIYTKRDRARIKMILRGKHLGFSLQDAAKLISLYDLDNSQIKQYEEGIKLAYKHLSEVRERQKELELLESDLLNAIEDAESRYNALKEKGQSDE